MLSDKDLAFCYEYCNNGYNASKAYLATHPNAEKSAANSGYRLLSKKEIREKVQEICKDRFEALDITGEKITMKLAEIAFSEKGDEYYNAPAQLRALDTLTKIYKLIDAAAEIKTDVIKVELKGD